MKRLLLHYLDHLILGVLIFLGGVFFERCASFHHDAHGWRPRP